MGNLGDVKQVRAKRKDAQKFQDKFVMAVKHVMATPDGRFFIHNFLTLTHMFHSSFDQNPIITAYREGERNIGLQYFATIMNECLPEYLLMMKENHDDRREPTDDSEGANGSSDDASDDDAGTSTD